MRPPAQCRGVTRMALDMAVAWRDEAVAVYEFLRGAPGFEEHLERLERSRTRVAKNRRRGRYGLVLVIVGFVLQGVAIWL